MISAKTTSPAVEIEARRGEKAGEVGDRGRREGGRGWMRMG
jgi:hypothetical protein